MIDWKAFKVTEPSATKNKPDFELQRMITAKELPKYLFTNFLVTRRQWKSTINW